MAKDTAIQWMLLEWGRWSRSDKRLGFPSMIPTERLRGGGVASALVTDHTAELIDHSVSTVGREHRVLALVLKMYYVKSLSFHRIASKLDIDRETVIRLLAKAEDSVLWELEG